jgi:hypothetical protein
VIALALRALHDHIALFILRPVEDVPAMLAAQLSRRVPWRSATALSRSASQKKSHSSSLSLDYQQRDRSEIQHFILPDPRISLLDPRALARLVRLAADPDVRRSSTVRAETFPPLAGTAQCAALVGVAAAGVVVAAGELERGHGSTCGNKTG